ncbi:MAG: tRNA (adenosine(37)-N6)-threonylcarbamoyltransferase complex ATPase subunit type 1 TsaE [Oscillospiraceae bacterium]|nr:tRNA (adenosine(37)-N6)-threonylcarbamoyltransferase complex ATPase subunit type 1 TsaE [Oscillospiraceae bacterium]
MISNSPEETENIAAEFAKTLIGGDCVALFGGLGAGKTAFVRGMARGLGIAASVSSPTFAIVNEYTGENVTLAHFDMYRLSTWEDLEACGFFEYLDSGAILAVEWSENILGALPKNAIEVTIVPVDNESLSDGNPKTDRRNITICGAKCLLPGC